MNCRKVKLILVAAAFLCLTLGFNGAANRNSISGPIVSNDVIELPPDFRHQWHLELTSVRLGPACIERVEGTLRNRSKFPVRLLHSPLTSQLLMGIRIWREDVLGSYRMRVKRGVSMVPIFDIIALESGAAVNLKWELNTTCPNAAEIAYEYTRSPYFLSDPRIGPRETLGPGKYVVDATIDVDVYDGHSDGLNLVGSVTVCSSNKLWVTVGKEVE